MTTPIPSPRILLGPGPSSVSPTVLSSLAQAPIGYLDPDLFELLAEIRSGLRSLFGTHNEFTIPLTGTGMAGMQSCFANLLEPGDSVVIGVCGFFGERMVEICRRLGADARVVSAEWGTPIDPESVRAAVDSTPGVKLVACVHAETSTGVRQPLEEIASSAHAAGALFLADAVTSLGGMAVEMDRSGIDVCYSGVQKCVGAPPGLAPLSVSEGAIRLAEKRNTPMQDWYFDWRLLRGYFDGAHLYHHTVPVNHYFALGQALREISEEGAATRYARHTATSDALLKGLGDMGIEPFALEGYRLPMLTTVRVPDDVADEAAVRRTLLQRFGIEIGGGLGHLKGKIWRIGTMGASATDRNVTMLLAALDELL